MNDLEAAAPPMDEKSSTGQNEDSSKPSPSPALIGLFDKPPGNDEKDLEGKDNTPTNNGPNQQQEIGTLFPNQADSRLASVDEESPLLVRALERESTIRINGGHQSQEYYTSTFSTEPIKPADFLGKKMDTPATGKTHSENMDEMFQNLKSFMGEFLVPNTWVGGAMFVLYHSKNVHHKKSGNEPRITIS